KYARNENVRRNLVWTCSCNCSGSSNTISTRSALTASTYHTLNIFRESHHHSIILSTSAVRRQKPCYLANSCCCRRHYSRGCSWNVDVNGNVKLNDTRLQSIFTPHRDWDSCNRPRRRSSISTDFQSSTPNGKLQSKQDADIKHF